MTQEVLLLDSVLTCAGCTDEDMRSAVYLWHVTSQMPGHTDPVQIDLQQWQDEGKILTGQLCHPIIAGLQHLEPKWFRLAPNGVLKCS